MSFLLCYAKKNFMALHSMWNKLYKGSIGLNFEWYHAQLKFKPGAVEKNESTIVLPAGIEPTLLRYRCSALATELQR